MKKASGFRKEGAVLKEFKAFILRGNVLDLAVGVIIGGAFGKIVSSLVTDILMPPIGLLLNGVNFLDLFVALNGGHYLSLAEAQTAGAPTLNYGLFFNNVIDFLIVALVIFLVVRIVNRLSPPPAPAPARRCPHCLLPVAESADRCPHCTSQI